MLEQIATHILPAALALLPPKMNSVGARAMMLAIGLQESQFKHRRQVGRPARGYWQFEPGPLSGTAQVMTYHSTKELAKSVIERLHYPTYFDHETVCYVLEHNDVLACAFARLLLYTHPSALPGPNAPEHGWMHYLATWHPGKPHRDTWDENFKRGWELA